MSKYNLLSELIERLAQFESEVDVHDHRLDMFAQWLQQKQGIQAENKVGVSQSFSTENPINEQISSEIIIGQMLTSMYRYAKHYAKRAFENTPIRTLDEFGYLAPLVAETTISKSELIQRNQMEMPTGMEIIRRLMKLKLIREEVDPTDRRAKLLSLTPLGHATIFQLFESMNKIAHMVSGPLTAAEKQELIGLLTKLRFFHQRVHQNHKNADLDTLLEAYLPKQL